MYIYISIYTYVHRSCQSKRTPSKNQSGAWPAPPQTEGPKPEGCWCFFFWRQDTAAALADASQVPTVGVEDADALAAALLAVGADEAMARVKSIFLGEREAPLSPGAAHKESSKGGGSLQCEARCAADVETPRRQKPKSAQKQKNRCESCSHVQ